MDSVAPIQSIPSRSCPYADVVPPPKSAAASGQLLLRRENRPESAYGDPVLHRGCEFRKQGLVSSFRGQF